MLQIIKVNLTDTDKVKVCGLLDSVGVLKEPDPDNCSGVPYDEVLCYTVDLGNKCLETTGQIKYGVSNPPSVSINTTESQDGVGASVIVPNGYTLLSIKATDCTGNTVEFNGNFTEHEYPNPIDNQCSDFSLEINVKDDCDRTYSGTITIASPGSVNLTLTDSTPSYEHDADGCVLFTGTDFGLSSEQLLSGVYYVKVTMKYRYLGEIRTYTTLTPVTFWKDTCVITDKIGEYISEANYNLATQLRLTYEAFLLSDNCAYDYSCVILERLNELLGDDFDCGCT